MKQEIKVVCKRELEGRKYKIGKTYIGGLEEHNGKYCYPNNHCTLVWIDQGEDNPKFGSRFAVKGNVRANHRELYDKPIPYWDHYTKYFVDLNIWERKEKLNKINKKINESK